jgi:hypothetical protein
VIVPARNEEASLPASLDALAYQVGEEGQPLDPDSFEILLLLNNCTDSSAAVAHHWRDLHPDVNLSVIERSFAPDKAHVGTARRLLMDTAWHRLHDRQHQVTGILSTDSDTLVDPRWIASTLKALSSGADAVGGVIQLTTAEFASLPSGAKRAYLRDRRYQRLVAELEDLLDPQQGDPWPRHLEHFGASLACTPQAYARAGGMPAVKPLEDVAFVDALRRSDARLRHDPAVIVYTSARLDGRAEIGLSHQLRLWQRMSEEKTEHAVPSAHALIHRFRVLSGLRHYFRGESDKLFRYPDSVHQRLASAKKSNSSVAGFLCEIDCDRLIRESFQGKPDGPVHEVNRNLSRAIQRLRRAQ